MREKKLLGKEKIGVERRMTVEEIFNDLTSYCKNSPILYQVVR